MGCGTCGSVGAGMPAGHGYSKDMLCNCGFSSKTEICAKCYTRFPHEVDSGGALVTCPNCKGIVCWIPTERLNY